MRRSGRRTGDAGKARSGRGAALAAALMLTACSAGTNGDSVDEAEAGVTDDTTTFSSTDDDRPDDGAESETAVDGDPTTESTEVSAEVSADDGLGTADEAAAGEVVTDAYAQWMACSGDPSTCDPAAAFGDYVVPDSQAAQAWIEQATLWQATSTLVSTPAGSADENFSVLRTTSIEGDEAVVVSCIRDVRAEYTSIGGDLTPVEGTDNPSDYLVQYLLVRLDGGWRISSLKTLETASLIDGEGLCDEP